MRITAWLLVLVAGFSLQLVSPARVLTGTVHDAQRQPIANAWVQVLQLPARQVFVQTRSNDKGAFQLELPTAGQYLLRVSASGYTDHEQPLGAGNVLAIVLQVNKEIEKSGEDAMHETAPSAIQGRAVGGKVHRREYKKDHGNTYGMRPPHPVTHQPDAVDQPHNTEGYDAIQENIFLSTAQRPLSTFSIDVDVASYANVRRYLNGGQRPPKDAVRIEEMVNYFNYSYPQPTGETPFSINTELTACPWNPEHRLVLVGLQGRKVATENLPPSNLVFLIDVSGSMSADNKLPLLKSSFRLLVQQLRPQDRVALVVYAGAAGLVLPSTPGNEKEKIIAALDALNAGGSTAGGAGIQLAYKVALENLLPEGNNRVIIATDGDFNVGASSDAEMERLIEEKRKTGIYLTCLGYGMGNYKDSKLEKLADKGNGNYAYIDNIQEANKTLVKQFGGTLFTIAKDVKIQIEFNPTVVQAYRLIGYENRLLKDEDFKDDKKDAGELGSGHTVTALYEVIPVGVQTKLPEIKPLKYQTEHRIKREAYAGDELMTVALRYKQPRAEASTEVQSVLKNQPTEGSENLRWAAAVVQLGMLLRESEHKGQSSFDSMIQLAEGARGTDAEGYRAEMIRLAWAARNLK